MTSRLNIPAPRTLHSRYGQSPTACRIVFALLGAVYMNAVGIADVGTVYSPNEFEQYQLQLLNRARRSPLSEVDRLSGLPWGDQGSPATPDLNEGLAAGTLDYDAKPPLAFSLALVQAARNHSQFLLQNDAWGHYEPTDGQVGQRGWTGASPTDRARFAGYQGAAGENLAVAASTATWRADDWIIQAEARHNDLFIDGDVSGRGHRVNALDTDWTEIGIGNYFASDYQGPFSRSFPSVNMVTYNFGWASSPTPQLTGVLFQDVDGDAFYTPNGQEFLGGVELQLLDESGESVGQTTTFAESGGWNLPLQSLSGGRYQLVAGELPRSLNTILCPDAECWIDIPAGGATENIGVTVVASYQQPDPVTCPPGELAADFNGDNRVDFADFLALAQHFTRDEAEHDWGDANCDQTVNFADFLVLAQSFGQSVEEITTAVPEPTGRTLICVLAAACGVLRRRRSSGN